MLAANSAAVQAPARAPAPFEADWRFVQQNAPGTEKVAFNDAAWKTVTMPHDWSIAGTYDRANPTDRGGDYLPGGVGWYRKL